jgi:hypothetical protein
MDLELDFFPELLDENTQSQYVSLEMICEISAYLTESNPITFEIYLAENDKYLSVSQKIKIRSHITKLRRKEECITRRNIEYMDREPRPSEDI